MHNEISHDFDEMHMILGLRNLCTKRCNDFQARGVVWVCSIKNISLQKIQFLFILSSCGRTADQEVLMDVIRWPMDESRRSFDYPRKPLERSDRWHSVSSQKGQRSEGTSLRIPSTRSTIKQAASQCINGAPETPRIH